METEVKKQTGEVTNNQVNIGYGFKHNRGQTDYITHRSKPKHGTDKRAHGTETEYGKNKMLNIASRSVNASCVRHTWEVR